MVKLSAFGTVFLAFLLPNTAFSTYLGDYAKWKQGTPDIQQIYILGVFDGWMNNYSVGEAPWIKARRNGLISCLQRDDVNPITLAEAVSSHYQAYVADWKVPPSVVFQEIVQTICMSEINKARAEIGLDPWERKTFPISKSDKE